MDETLVFDEAEVKMEIIEDECAKRKVPEDNDDFMDPNDLIQLQPLQPMDMDSDSESQNESDDADIFSELSSESHSDTDDLRFLSIEPDYPPVTQTGPGKKLPSHLESVLEDFRDQLIFSKSRRKLSELKTSADSTKATKQLLEWQELTPECHEKLEKQLAYELLSYACVKSLVNTEKSEQKYSCDVTQEQNDGAVRIEDVGGFFASVMPADGGDNEVLNFFHKLKEHESFQKYRKHIDTLSEDQISSLVWDASVKAQSTVLKLSKLHESSLTNMDKIIKLNREIIGSVENECQVLEQNVMAEASKVTEIAGKSELTTVGRKQLYRAFLAPYFKTESGFAAPLWKPVSVPFKMEDLRQASLTPTELEILQASVLETVRDTKKAYIEDRCCQILLKNDQREQTQPKTSVEFKLFSIRSDPSSSSISSLNANVTIVCRIDSFLRWKNDSIKKAEQITMEEIVNDKSVYIDWLGVSAKISSHMGKSFCPDELQGIWEKLILPGLRTTTKMSIAQLQKLMECVKKYGKRKWDKVAADMGSSFTPFQCFSAYERFSPGELSAYQRSIESQRQLQTGSACFNKIVKLGAEFVPTMSMEKFANLSCQVTGILVDTPNIPQQTLAEHYNRFSNPVTVKGSFRLVEDLLLLICLVKMREYLRISKTFAPLKDYLPWRFISAWAIRADVLFSHKRTLWSREEDLKLLNFAKTHRKFDWKLFSLHLGPDKNRKNTRSRYVLLQERLQVESFDKIREEYESKDRTRRLYLDYEKFVTPLETTLTLPQTKPPSLDVLRTNPSEDTLWNYLASFDKDIIRETISDLKQVIVHCTAAQNLVSVNHDNNLEESETSGEQEKNKIAAILKKPIDRRRFIRGDAESTASSIHLRKLTLKLESEVGSLSPFQKEIYHYYKTCFEGRSVKSSTKHNYIPTIQMFMKMAELQKIVDWPKSKVDVENLKTDGVELDDSGRPIATNLPKPPRRKKRRGVISDNKGRKKKVIKQDSDVESDQTKDQEQLEDPNPEQDPKSNEGMNDSEARSESESLFKSESHTNETQSISNTPNLPSANEVLIKVEGSSMFDFEESQIILK